MDIDETRRANICALEKIAGTPRAAADAVEMTYAQYLNYRNGAKEAKTGKIRGMRKETAWRFEDAFGKPRGWLVHHPIALIDEADNKPAQMYATTFVKRDQPLLSLVFRERHILTI